MSTSIHKCTKCGERFESEVDAERAVCVCPYCDAEVPAEEGQFFADKSVVGAADEPKEKASGEYNSGAEDLIKKAEALLFLGEFQNAKATLTKAIRLNPSDWRARFGMVRYYTNNLTDFSNARHLQYLAKARAVASSAELIELNATYENYRHKKELIDQEKNDKPVTGLAGIKQEMDLKWEKSAQRVKKTLKISGIVAAVLTVVIVAVVIVVHFTEDFWFDIGYTRAHTYKVTYSYVGEDGNEVTVTDKFVYDKELPEAPQKAGYILGWFTSEECNNESRYRFDKRPEDVVDMQSGAKEFRLYTRWIAIYTIFFNTNGGLEMLPRNAEDGEEITLEHPMKAGGKFLGWFKDQDMTQGVSKYVITQNVTVYAKWLVQYTVMFNTDGGTKINDVLVGNDTTFKEPRFPEKEGFQFAGWYADAGLTEAVQFPLTLSQNCTLYAKWAILYKIVFNMNGAPSRDFVYVNVGESFAAPTDPFWTGHQFDGWFTDPAMIIPAQFPLVPTGALDLYAKWSRVQVFRATAVSAGERFSLATDSDGKLWAWGYNGDTGRFGNGEKDGGNVPVLVNEELQLVRVSSGKDHNVAIDKDGYLWAWGNGSNGRLGNGGSASSNIPVRVSTDNKFTTVSVGSEHTLAIDTTGVLWAWGNGGNGRLGDGASQNRNIPVLVLTDKKFVAIAAGDAHSLAIDTTGVLWAWGSDGSGRLGNGAGNGSDIPVLVETTKTFTAIAAGNEHSLALDTDGYLWAFGNGGNGRLGNGQQNNSQIPVLVSSDKKFTVIAAGNAHNLAIDEDGSLWTWGNGGNGRLGDGASQNRSVPVLVFAEFKITAIAAGNEHSLAVDENGDVYAFGSGGDGRLGGGSNAGKNVPSLAN